MIVIYVSFTHLKKRMIVDTQNRFIVECPLYTLINNWQKESTSGIAILKEVEVETFIRFNEHTYTATYITPGSDLDQPLDDKVDLNSIDKNNQQNDLSLEHVNESAVENMNSNMIVNPAPPSEPALEDSDGYRRVSVRDFGA